MCGENQLGLAIRRLGSFCGEVRVSVRSEQAADEPYRNHLLLPDPPGIEGPIAGITAAFAHAPDSAWLSIAVDMPYVEPKDLRLLVEARGPGAEVCCFYNPTLDGPEPLLALYEPAFRRRLEEFVTAGGRSLFRLLNESPLRLIEPPDEWILTSVNTPAEHAYALEAVCEDY